MSLQGDLIEYIKKENPRMVTYDEFIEEFKRLSNKRILEEGKPYKLSNAERRMRRSESPMIETHHTENGSVKGYSYIMPDIPKVEPKREEMHQDHLFPLRTIFN